MFVCVVPLSQPSSRELVYPPLGCSVSEKISIKKNKRFKKGRVSFRFTRRSIFFGTVRDFEILKIKN